MLHHYCKPSFYMTDYMRLYWHAPFFVDYVISIQYCWFKFLVKWLSHETYNITPRTCQISYILILLLFIRLGDVKDMECHFTLCIMLLCLHSTTVMGHNGNHQIPYCNHHIEIH